jgi:hypothetical protein
MRGDLGILVISFCLAGTVGVATQRMAFSPEERRSFTSSDWHVREKAFGKVLQRLQSPDDTLQLSSEDERAIIALMETESHYKPTPQEYETEVHSDFFASVVKYVVRLGDMRAAEALLEPEILTTGNLAVQGVATIGHPIVARVCAIYDAYKDTPANPYLEYKGSLVFLLGELATRTNDPADIRNIESRIIHATRDPDQLQRIAAVRALSRVPTASARQALRDIADTEPTMVTVRGQTRFPVREMAAKLLEHS